MKNKTIRELLTGFFLGMLGSHLGMSLLPLLAFAIAGGLVVHYIIKEIKTCQKS